ncbi:MAG: tRNA (guanosine(46)-N7)-methyltransferase TrmB [Mariprofundaceae bacterium]|nr:tRNA (guanosine(46)-N7)-methyltransferase TrmB [Mariprofundaceae bacterium]
MRTHGRKNGFVTQGQEQRLTHCLPKIGLPVGKHLDDSGFSPSLPVVMEIGFGNGDFLVHLAKTHVTWQLLGIEIYLPGVAKAVGRLDDAGVLPRCRISQTPAQVVLSQQISAEHLHGIYINHPDPWPKKRHHKRRLIQQDFATLMVSRLKVGGFIRLATDKPDLAIWMQKILDHTAGLENTAGVGGFIVRDDDRPFTKFEQRGLKEGRDSEFLHYIKVKNVQQLP